MIHHTASSALAALLFTVSATIASGGIITGSNLVFHYDAQDLNGNGLTNDNPGNGTQVGNWVDKSSFGFNLNQSTGTPTYMTGGPNGLNYVQFNRNSANQDERLFTTNSITAPQLAGTTKKTLSTFMVLRYTSGVVYFKWEDGGNAARRHGAEGNNRWDFNPASEGGNPPINNWSSTLTTGGVDWRILELVADVNDTANPNLIDPDGVLKVYLNGDLVKIFGMDAGVLDDAHTSLLHLGGNNGGQNSLSAVVDFAELAHYNTALNEAERGQVGAFLAEKYGITTSYSFALVPEPHTSALVATALLCCVALSHRRLRRRE